MLRGVVFMAGIVVAVALFAPDFVGRYFDRTATADQPRPSAMSISAPERSASYGGNVRIQADRNGHYLNEARIEGRPVDFMVDTGASLVVLRYEDARALGLVYGSDTFEVAVQTANGAAKAHRVKLNSVRLGSIWLDDVDALVMGEGVLRTNLLGMSFLKRLSRYEVRDGMLVLER